MKKTYKIEVDCANCARKMEEATKKVEGVADAAVSFMTQMMKVEFDEGAEDKFFKYYKMEINDAVLPQYCNILELTSMKFKYNNEGFRATYDLIRAN